MTENINENITEVRNFLTRTGAKTYSVLEELLNTLTHGMGLLLSIGAVIWLVYKASTTESEYILISAIIYGGAMVFLYLSSTLYHSFFPLPAVKRVLKVIDHISIFLFIAGSYTPIALVLMHGTTGWVMFITVWTLALIGIIQKIFFIRKFKVLPILLYLGMGWFAVVFFSELYTLLPTTGLLLLVSGGVAYSVGVIFYLLDNVPYMHSIWHLFVLAGSVLHFLVMQNYVLV